MLLISLWTSLGQHIKLMVCPELLHPDLHLVGTAGAIVCIPSVASNMAALSLVQTYLIISDANYEI